MKRTFIMLALLTAVPGIAHAANLNGTYSVVLTQLCQSIDNEVFKPSTVINTINDGKLSQSVGFVTMTPSTVGGLTGKISARLTQSQGSLTILGLPGPPVSPPNPDMVIQNATQTGTFSLTLGSGLAPSTLSLTFSGDKLRTYKAYFSQLSGGVYKHGTFINLSGNNGGAPTCTNQGTLDLM